MLSIVYTFNVHAGVASPPRSPLTPSIVSGGIEADRVSFSTESTVCIHHQFHFLQII